MKIVAVIFLVLSFLFLVFEFAATYIPLDRLSPPCHGPDGTPCQTLVPQVIPNALFPFWLPPIAFVAWVFSLTQYRKQEFAKSILFSLMIILQFFISWHLGLRGYFGLKY